MIMYDMIFSVQLVTKVNRNNSSFDYLYEIFFLVIININCRCFKYHIT